MLISMKDITVAHERYADFRREAAKHNAAARMVAGRPAAHPMERVAQFWGRMRRGAR
ncbi:MAG: hypothetical protein IPK16_24540 [Anaerolineales bacterium]|nr:hypothetical protein [Anaerolineales bacterium]